MKNKNNQYTLKKYILRLTILLLSLLILIVTVITVTSTAKSSNLAFGDYKFYVMKTNNAPNTAELGDLVIAKKQKAQDLAIGDSIVYGSGKDYYCDSITEIKVENETKIITSGDINKNKNTFTENTIEGKVVKVISRVGFFVEFLRTVPGVILMLALFTLLFILLRLLFIEKAEA